MSRIGKRPIDIPDKVQVSLDGQTVSVKGPKGELSRSLCPEILVEQANGMLVCSRRDESRVARQRHGLSRTLVANMIEGVSQGFEKTPRNSGCWLSCSSPRQQSSSECGL